MLCGANFKLWVSEEGVILPESIREGHNVFTDFGREWLKQIAIWDIIGAADVSLDERRLRWLGVGGGGLSEITSVDEIDSPLTITTGPDEYIRILGTRTEPTNFSQKFVTVFTGASADFDHHGASVDVSEAGIFVDVHDGIGTLLSPATANNKLVAYKSFTKVNKAAAQTLTITWEFRF